MYAVPLTIRHWTMGLERRGEDCPWFWAQFLRINGNGRGNAISNTMVSFSCNDLRNRVTARIERNTCQGQPIKCSIPSEMGAISARMVVTTVEHTLEQPHHHSLYLFHKNMKNILLIALIRLHSQYGLTRSFCGDEHYHLRNRPGLRLCDQEVHGLG